LGKAANEVDQGGIMSKKAEESNVSRRQFIGTAVVAGAALAACAGPAEAPKAIKLGEKMTPGPAIAPDGAPIKAGLIGCGGRGTGAALNFLSAGPNLEIVALADAFKDRVEDCRAKLKTEKGVEIADDNCFVGFDAYQRLIDSGVDMVIIATPPHFRPAQFEAAIEGRKNVFMEKPLAVDPVGARSIMATAERADALGLKVVTGTQRRHQREYIETYNRVMDGAIGEIVAARCYWNQGQLWFKEPQKGQSDMEAMLRDWVNWIWLSGDHIVEQHIHNVDVINWFTNSHPVSAVGMGGRERRVTGDQYDYFSIDYTMENGVHVQSMCRQIDGCANNVSEFIVGTNGSSNCANKIFGPDGKLVWEYKEEEKAESESYDAAGPYVQEHIDLVTAIRTDTPINEAMNTAISTMTALMGRTSAYTGLEITWDEMMKSDSRLGPEEYKMGPMDMTPNVPVPGTSKV
jgi:predicted dehydrogenase